MKLPFFLLALVSSGLALPLSRGAVYQPCGDTGKVFSNQKESSYFLGNNLMTARYTWAQGKLDFDSLTLKNKTLLAKGNKNLFTFRLKDGTILSSSEMQTKEAPVWVDLRPDAKMLRLSEKSPGKALECTFISPEKGLNVKWRAVLREGSHYLRTEMDITATKEVAVQDIVALSCSLMPGTGKGSEVTVSGNTRGSLVVSPLAFAGLETPFGMNSVKSAASPHWSPLEWNKDSWREQDAIPTELKKEWGNHLLAAEGPVTISGKGECKLTFSYKSGNTRLNLAGVELLSPRGKLLSSDYHSGFTGETSSKNTYKLQVPSAGKYLVRYWVENKAEPVTSSGTVVSTLPLKALSVAQGDPQVPQPVEGKWKRNAILLPGETWTVSSVLGVMAPQQARRSVLAYVERERAVPYRPFFHYNSWYELNINRNDNPDPLKRMTEKQCLDVLAVWHEELYKKRGVSLDAFVWDDGWDEFHSLWDFHKGFPRGFSELNKKAAEQKAGQGTWLGPVGGYGSSKSQRLDNWNQNHPNNKIGNFQLSNKEYYDAFKERCAQMIRDYDMRYFKFDGISTHFHATGPDESREQDAESILKLVSELRTERPDLFVNCTVGTWASPFWFRYVDSIWRQENDWGDIGEGNARERWITYRDRLVWEVFVKGAPLCPINSLMFHGAMVTRFGPPAQMPNDVDGIKKELRCAFGCGSALQELYLDNDLMSGLGQNGELWDEAARGIKWLRSNADVMADVHWVGGNPWDQETKKASIYGWAAWSPEKAVLTLRNPSQQEQNITFTLRQALDLPPHVKGKFRFRNVYGDQRSLPGFTDVSVDADAPLSLILKPFEVFVWEKGK